MENKTMDNSIYAKIRYVENYFPEQKLEEGYSSTGEKVKYLPLKEKKKWAMLACPNYALDTIIVEQTTERCVVEARFYEDCNDTRPRFKRRGSCNIYQLRDISIPEAQIEEELINTATGSAQTRVLRDAGFGLALEYEEETYLEQFTKNASKLRAEMANTTASTFGNEDDFNVEQGDSKMQKSTTKGTSKKRNYQEIYDDNVNVMIEMINLIERAGIELEDADESATITLTHDIATAKAKFNASSFLVQEKLKKDEGKGKLVLRSDCPAFELEEVLINKIIDTDSIETLLEEYDVDATQITKPELLNTAEKEIVVEVEKDQPLDLEVCENNFEQEEMFMENINPGDRLLTYGKYVGKKINDVSLAELLFLYKKETNSTIKDAIKYVINLSDEGKAKFNRVTGA